MPELPEMQALAERIESFVGGATFTGYEPLHFSALKTYQPPPENLIGKTLEDVSRRGKYVLLGFASPERSGGANGVRVAFHLSQGGRVDFEDPPKKTKGKGYVARWKFDTTPERSGGAKKAVLIKEFGTERKAGWWVLEKDDIGPMEGLGPEPDSDEFKELIRTGADSRRIHTILRDQRTVAGLGRGYTDDILHAAKISPFASLKTLKEPDRERLIETVREILAQGLELERKRTGGLPTKIGDHWIVHHEHGHPCPACGDDLRRVSYESHEVTYCPTCQTGGKILADRRMSRLIR